MASDLAAKLVKLCTEKKLLCATAESCTGGMVAAAITDIPGASAVFDRGFVTYSNQSKIEALGVDEVLIDAYGAVSEEVTKAMAQGALKHSNVNISVAISGIAGPGGGTKEKPVGLVFFAAAARHGELHAENQLFSGSRAEIRQLATEKALEMLYEAALKS